MVGDNQLNHALRVRYCISADGWKAHPSIVVIPDIFGTNYDLVRAAVCIVTKIIVQVCTQYRN